MDTLGSLIDKLTIVNLKIWMFEDVKRDSKNDHIVADATRKTNILNRQRNNLIQEIDELVIGLIDGSKIMKNYELVKKYGNKK